MAEGRERDTEPALLEQLYSLVGGAAEGELVSETLLQERREEAAREAQEDE